MADFQVTTAVTGKKIDTRWRASAHGEDSARPGQLDPTAFVSGTHYNLNGATDNVIPSGTAVALLASGLYGPFDITAGTTGDARRKLAGFINDDGGVELGTSPSTSKPTFALLVHGLIRADLLPIAAQRTTVATAEAGGQWSGSFVKN